MRGGIYSNKKLLSLLMVTTGKALLGRPSNNYLVDDLLKNQISINSVDQNGMTALHHAVQNFYNYRVEQLQLIQKLIDSGIDINAKDRLGRTAMDLAKAHSQKDVVSGSESVFKLISTGSAQSKKKVVLRKKNEDSWKYR